MQCNLLTADWRRPACSSPIQVGCHDGCVISHVTFPPRANIDAIHLAYSGRADRGRLEELNILQSPARRGARCGLTPQHRTASSGAASATRHPQITHRVGRSRKLKQFGASARGQPFGLCAEVTDRTAPSRWSSRRLQSDSHACRRQLTYSTPGVVAKCVPSDKGAGSACLPARCSGRHCRG